MSFGVELADVRRRLWNCWGESANYGFEALDNLKGSLFGTGCPTAAELSFLGLWHVCVAFSATGLVRDAARGNRRINLVGREMRNHDDDFRARVKRVRARSCQDAPMPHRRRLAADDVGEQPIIGAILRPQLALILGALALVASRAIAMNYLMTEPSIHLLGWGEGLVVLLLLFVIGLLFGKWDPVSHGALVVGAAVAFHAETYYIPFVPELMKSIYNPHYVSLVLLNAQ